MEINKTQKMVRLSNFGIQGDRLFISLNRLLVRETVNMIPYGRAARQMSFGKCRFDRKGLLREEFRIVVKLFLVFPTSEEIRFYRVRPGERCIRRCESRIRRNHF